MLNCLKYVTVLYLLVDNMTIFLQSCSGDSDQWCFLALAHFFSQLLPAAVALEVKTILAKSKWLIYAHSHCKIWAWRLQISDEQQNHHHFETLSLFSGRRRKIRNLKHEMQGVCTCKTRFLWLTRRGALMRVRKSPKKEQASWWIRRFVFFWPMSVPCGWKCSCPLGLCTGWES